MKRQLAVLLPAFAALLMSSCGRYISSENYTASQVGEASMTHRGVVIGMREVTVQNADKLGDNATGAVAGGVAGGVLGNALGHKSGVATAAGALAGAVGGAFLENRLSSQQAYEYQVEIENGQILTVVQGKEERLYVGQPVYVIGSWQGRSRVIPR